MAGRDDLVKEMANLMMQGAIMLDKTCPLDNLPLFKLRNGDIVCPRHGKVVIVASEEEARDVEVEGIIREVRYRAAKKVLESMDDNDVAGMKEWLAVLEAAERILSLRRGSTEQKSSENKASAGKSGR
ncbi:MAG: hypothetical protein F7B20_00580 [Aeropyrum sp.]|nr:hypothetical protein [Aeropyrum sp.]MCE4616191.1 hypothetical protein [Aeropyrum sp.]